MSRLDNVISALGITGDYQDSTLNVYINEVESFLTDAGVRGTDITDGLVARGVSDLWDYGAGNGAFSSYFIQRATQLSYRRN